MRNQYFPCILLQSNGNSKIYHSNSLILRSDTKLKKILSPDGKIVKLLRNNKSLHNFFELGVTQSQNRMPNWFEYVDKAKPRDGATPKQNTSSLDRCQIGTKINKQHNEYQLMRRTQKCNMYELKAKKRAKQNKINAGKQLFTEKINSRLDKLSMTKQYDANQYNWRTSTKHKMQSIKNSKKQRVKTEHSLQDSQYYTTNNTTRNEAIMPLSNQETFMPRNQQLSKTKALFDIKNVRSSHQIMKSKSEKAFSLQPKVKRIFEKAILGGSRFGVVKGNRSSSLLFTFGIGV